MSAPRPSPANVHDLALRARQGELSAIRALHFGTPHDRAPVAADLRFCHLAGPTLIDLLDKQTPPRPHPPLRRGGIDFHRLHCLALDRLPELLAVILPQGREAGSWGGRWCWIGSHPMRPESVHVCLMVGVWTEPNTGRAGLDLVSLYSHVFGVSHGRGAHLLAQWLGAEVRAYAA